MYGANAYVRLLLKLAGWVCAGTPSGTPVHGPARSLRHSPSFSARQSQVLWRNAFTLAEGKALVERVGDHVVSWAINETHGALLDDPSDEVVVHIDVLGP